MPTTMLPSPTSTPPSNQPNWRSVERTFTTFDGTQLFYRSWFPQSADGEKSYSNAHGTCSVGSPPAKAMLLFHRGHEHSARWNEFVQSLHLADTAIFAWDARGHGQSPGDRGWAPNFSTLVQDADAFARHITHAHGFAMQDISVIAHSVGAVIAAAWVHDYAPPIRALVLATPALAVKLYVPLAIPSLRALNKVKKKAFITSYVKSKMLTHDPEQAAAYDADPLISKQIAVNILLDLHDASKRLINDAGAIATPTLILGAGSDWVVKNSAAAKFFHRLSSPQKDMFIFPGMGHAIFHENERQQVTRRIEQFLDQVSQPPQAQFQAVQNYTRREYEKLLKPRPAYCPIGLNFKIQKLAMKSLLKLSAGVRIGWKTGFDSGQSLDYVYRNRATGITPLGKLIDYFYLNAIGWRGIRQRRANLDAALRQTIQNLRAQDKPVHILDIAAGPGRYVLQALADLRDPSITATLRDRSPSALEEGRQLAAQLNVTSATFETGDAFSHDQLAKTNPRPNIAIVSGLYELFPDNVLIQQSLAGLAAALQPGGYLLYTNQPWHPQIEMIARTLTNRDQKPWIMRRRTQYEMDHLVQQAGFDKQFTQIDQWGIFTVNIAKRI